MRPTSILTAAILSATAAGLTAPAAAGVIDTLPGLVYHLDAASGVSSVGGAVSAWADVNANGVTFAQATAAKQPTLIGGAAAGNINGLPVVRFDGDLTGNAGGVAPSADELVSSATHTVQTVIIVNRTLQHRNLDGIWGVNNGDTGVRRASATNWQHPGNANDFSNGGSLFVNGSETTAAALNAPNILVATRGASTSFVGTSIGDYFLVGANTPRAWNGDIAELAVFNRALTAGERFSIEAELGAKYNITVPEPATLGPVSIGALTLLTRRRRA